MSTTVRPVVRITFDAPTGHHRAVCGTGDCAWVYTNPVKAACEEQARWHRASHRRAGW